jgi:hypothetical protein
MYTSVYICIYVYINVYMYIYVYVYMYICIYVYIQLIISIIYNTHTGPTALALACPRLSWVALGPRITDASVTAFAWNCAYLEFFDISGNAGVTGAGVLVLAGRNSGTFLCISRCRVGRLARQQLQAQGVRFRV